MGMNRIQEHAKAAGATYKMGNKVLINYAYPQGDIAMAMNESAEVRAASRGIVGYDSNKLIESMKEQHDQAIDSFEAYLEKIRPTMITKQGIACMDAIDKAWAAYKEVDAKEQNYNMIDNVLNNGVEKFNRKEDKQKLQQGRTSLKERLCAKQCEVSEKQGRDPQDQNKVKKNSREMQTISLVVVFFISMCQTAVMQIGIDRALWSEGCFLSEGQEDGDQKEFNNSKFVEGEVMGLLERLKLNKTKDFFEWLDLILKNELNSEIKAINFNLYEDTDNKWSVELVGTFSFDKDNDDWACDEVFTTRDHPFVIECESDWELVETFFVGLVNEYLSSGKYAGKLKEYQAIGIGFVDGDLHILYAR